MGSSMLRRGGQGESGRSALTPAGSSTSKLEVIVIDADQFTCRMRRRYSSCKRPSSGERPPALLMRLSLGSVQMGWRRLSWCGLAGFPRKGGCGAYYAPQPATIFYLICHCWLSEVGSQMLMKTWSRPSRSRFTSKHIEGFFALTIWPPL